MLAADLEQLSKVVNHNANLFTHTLTVAEMRQTILQRVVNDQLIGELHIAKAERTRWTEEWGQKGDGSVGTIDVPKTELVDVVDYAWYQQYFMCCMVFTELATWLKGLGEASAKVAKEKVEMPSPIVMSDYEGAQVFGGSP